MAKNEEVVKVETTKKQVDAQVIPPRDADTDKVDVHEVSVTTDRVITNPAAEDAVQLGEPGEGTTLPIHSLDAPSAEQTLASGDATEAPSAEDYAEGKVAGDEKSGAPTKQSKS